MHWTFWLNISLFSLELWRISTVKRSLRRLPDLFFCLKVFDKIGRSLQAVALFSGHIMTLIALGGFNHEVLSVITAAVIKSWSANRKRGQTSWENKCWREMLWRRTDLSKAIKTNSKHAAAEERAAAHEYTGYIFPSCILDMLMRDSSWCAFAQMHIHWSSAVLKAKSRHLQADKRFP